MEKLNHCVCTASIEKQNYLIGLMVLCLCDALYFRHCGAKCKATLFIILFRRQ